MSDQYLLHLLQYFLVSIKLQFFEHIDATCLLELFYVVVIKLKEPLKAHQSQNHLLTALDVSILDCLQKPRLNLEAHRNLVDNFFLVCALQRVE